VKCNYIFGFFIPIFPIRNLYGTTIMHKGRFLLTPVKNKNLCGRDGRTICGPLCVPKSTYVTLARKRKQKFFYFACSLVRRFYCKIKKTSSNNGTDGQTDRVRRNMRPPPREEGRIIIAPIEKCFFGRVKKEDLTTGQRFDPKGTLPPPKPEL